MTIKMIKLRYISLPLLALSATSHGAVLLYQETFNYATPGWTDNPSNTSHNDDEINWRAHSGTGATDASGHNNQTTGGLFGIANANGLGGTRGYAAKVQTGSTGIAWTEEFAAYDRSLAEISHLNVSTSNSDGQLRFAVRIDATWYVTDQTFTPVAGGSTFAAGNVQTHTFNFTTNASAWRLLTLDPGNELYRDSDTLASALPNGNLTAAGIFFEANASVIRYDQFEVWLTPEPSALALGVLGGLLGLSRRRL